ncbi:hypothetical protein ERY13_06825 [Paenibacillus mucilaginosus]|uniref:glycoside hydrolase family 73 protein n=1 Tax=Paenibacillus mucilaginosus TaxID=61624 RepID=UPI00240DF9BA|nr:glycoside hydrolase family 73 protein [Paenibacillus mucilaginosus]WFA17053.1 hypothetical protein ERY13_06825 [Paenibacillus mucilaginosus]
MKPQEFFSLLGPAAAAEQIEHGVLASITLAQAALESGYGAYAEGNNLFGIKAKGSANSANQTTREYINGEWRQIVDSFRVYGSWAESIRDHSEFLLKNPTYTRAGVFTRSRALDYKGTARALQSAGYATDPGYANKLISIIEKYKLQEWDLQAAEEGGWIPMRLQHEWQWKQLGDALQGLLDQGVITDPSWPKKAYGKQLTLTELTWLNAVILARQSGVKV